MTDRAQTTLDFAVGISVFLITAVFVFGFVPGMLQPFNQGVQEETVAADRLASQLSEGALADPGEPYVLLTDCTVEFFNETVEEPLPPTCAYDRSTDLSAPDGLAHRVGMAPRQQLNVTIRADIDGGDVDTLCWDGDADALVEADESACTPGSDEDVLFAAGETPPSRSSSSVVTTRRTVGVEGHDARLIVRMW